MIILNCRGFPDEQVILKLPNLPGSNPIKGRLAWVKEEGAEHTNDLGSFLPRWEHSLEGMEVSRSSLSAGSSLQIIVAWFPDSSRWSDFRKVFVMNLLL